MSKKGEKYENQNIVERICPICGKRFVRAPFHVYREGNITVCGWNCLCELRRRKAAVKLTEQKRRKRYSPEVKAQAIDLVINQGLTRVDAAKRLGVTDMSVSLWVREYKQEYGRRKKKKI